MLIKTRYPTTTRLWFPLFKLDEWVWEVWRTTMQLMFLKGLETSWLGRILKEHIMFTLNQHLIISCVGTVPSTSFSSNDLWENRNCEYCKAELCGLLNVTRNSCFARLLRRFMHVTQFWIYLCPSGQRKRQEKRYSFSKRAFLSFIGD